MTNKILITGGMGHIGTHLSRFLIEKGYDVYILDNFFNNTVDYIDGAKFYRLPACKIATINVKFQYVFHFGEFSRVEQSFEFFDECIEYNRNSFSAVVNYCKSVNAKLIYSASSTINGDHGYNKYESPYAFTKYQNVEYLKAFCKWFDLNYSIVYFSNVYGGLENSSEKMGTVIAKFVAAKERGDDYVKITSPGTQRRYFTHISDTISAIYLVMKHGGKDDYFVAAEESYSIIEVANLLGIDYILTEAKKGNRMSSDIDTIKTKDLGWQCKHELSSYLDKIRNDYE